MTFRSHGMRSPIVFHPRPLKFYALDVTHIQSQHWRQYLNPGSLLVRAWPWTHVLVGQLTAVARSKSSLNLFEFRWTLQMLPWKLFQIQTGRVQRHCWGSLLCARRWKQKWVSPKFLQSLVTCNTTDLTDLYDKRKKEVPPCSIH